MYIKAIKNFDEFANKFKKKYNKFLDKEIFSKYDKLQYFIKNYHKLFTEIFPKNGLFVLNHNDVHRLNLLFSENKEKIIILDHEYASLNLIGVDLVNYLIESNFDYTLKEFPFHECYYDEIDFEHYYEIFKDFLNKFEVAHSSNFTNEKYKKKFDKMKSFKYFLKLVCLISLFWLLYSVIYLEFESFSMQKCFDYFTHAMDRIYIFEEAYKKLKILELKK
jgi:thiamine kinase-like enzyme